MTYALPSRQERLEHRQHWRRKIAGEVASGLIVLGMSKEEQMGVVRLSVAFAEMLVEELEEVEKGEEEGRFVNGERQDSL